MTRQPKKSKAAVPDFAEAQRACRTPTEREQLALVQKAGWKPAQLHELARLLYFKNGKDYPTPTSYRRALEDLSETYRALAYPDALLADCRTRSCTSGWWHSADAVRSHCRLDVMVCSSVGAANATASPKRSTLGTATPKNTDQ